MPSRKNKRFAKKKGKASLKKTFSKKRIVGGLNDYALVGSINKPYSVEPVPMANVKNDENDLSTLESTTPQTEVAQPAVAQPAPTVAPAAAPAVAQPAQPVPAPAPAAEAAAAAQNDSSFFSYLSSPSVAPKNNTTPNSSFWSSYLPSATAPSATAPSATAPSATAPSATAASATSQTVDSPETVNMLAYTGELEKLKAMVERNPNFKDGVTGFFPIPAISRAFDGIREHGNNITGPENIKRADIILYLISKGADVSSITATSASPEVMSYIIQNIPDDVPDAVHEKIKNISFELGNSMSVAAPEVPVKTLKKYYKDIGKVNNNFTDESANKLLISIANDGTVGDLIDFYRVIVGKKKSINDFINYQQVEAKLTPLMVACINNNTEIVKKILSTENISSTINDTILRHTILSTKDAYGNTFLHHAAYHYTLLDVIADYLQKISENDSHGIGTQKEFLSKAKNSSNDTAFSIVCKKEPTQFNLIKKLNDTGLIPEKDDISNPGFLELEKRFNELKTIMESTDYITKYDPETKKAHKAEIKEYLTLFKTIGYSLFNVRFADGTNFEQIYLQRWDNVLRKNDKKYIYKSVNCKKNTFSSCDPIEADYKEDFNSLLTKISQANTTLDGIYVVTYKSVCDGIQKKHGIFDTINASQFKEVDKNYFIDNSGNNPVVIYEENGDEIRNDVDKYIRDVFEEEFLKKIDRMNFKNKTKDYIGKSKRCNSLYIKSKCGSQTDMTETAENNKSFNDSLKVLIKKISEANTNYIAKNQRDKYITFKSIRNNIIEKYKLGAFTKQDYDLDGQMKLIFEKGEEIPKNVSYDKPPSSFFSSMPTSFWGSSSKSSNTHKRKHAQKQKNTRKHK
uniref:Uncharacterized protein n=1 Tax=viral metagenome TaxID=1070528 RepID=A0A6C0H2Z7_9ZZZZ